MENWLLLGVLIVKHIMVISIFYLTDGKIVADKPLDIAIPVSIAVGAFLLILIIIAVACFVCWK